MSWRWSAVLKDAAGITRIYIACGYTDLRKGIDGLTYMIQEQYGLHPMEKGTLFLFCGKRTDRIKAILFEGDGFLLLYKRLVPGFRYQWPRTALEAKQLTAEQYNLLMSGFNPLQKGLIGEVYPERLI